MTGHSYINGVYHYDAEPLDPADMPEVGSDDWEASLEIDGKTYLEDDVYFCSCCKSVHVSRGELDEEGECKECAEESRQEAAAEDEKWADYRADCR